MLNLPKETKIRKIIPKKKIYEKFSKKMTRKAKDNFNNDISKITIMNELSPHSINIEEGEEVKSIFVIRIDLKNENFSETSVAMIAKHFRQRILFVLVYEEKAKLAIYEERLLQSSYQELDSLSITLKGLNLDTLWEELVLSVSGYELKEDNTLKDQIKIEEQREKINRQIEKLEKQARRESQPKKSFELHQEVLRLKNILEEL